MLRNLPIRLKLVLIAMLTTGGALLLAGAAMIAFEHARSKKEMERDLKTLADIVAQNSTAALRFHDTNDALETLDALEPRKAIVDAVLYDAQGCVFARYQRRPGTRLPLLLESDAFHLLPGALVVFRPVTSDGETVGTVSLRSSLVELSSHARLQPAAAGA